MNISERMTALKPYIAGFVVGLIAAPAIAFGAGWVTTTRASVAAVESARIATLASVCSATATSLAAAGNMDLAKLRGYSNREQRDRLVESAMAELAVPPELLGRVTSGCSRTLA